GHERVGLTAWVVQLGSFSSETNANSLSERARQGGFAAFVDPLKSDKGVIYRVRVGPELRRSDAAALRDRLNKTLDVEAIVISYP
ncbi:MAG: SPOR domain-containing protein, partial [Gammaproteobacteria bacterium]